MRAINYAWAENTVGRRIRHVGIDVGYGYRVRVDAGPARRLYIIPSNVKNDIKASNRGEKTYMSPILREIRVVLSARRRRAGPASTQCHPDI